MKTDENVKSGYNEAFKATALFGGVQVITIILSIIKSKFVALWLGTVGFGIMSLFAAATNLIFSVSNLGLQSSAVRDIANVAGDKDQSLISKIVKAINRWVFVTGFLGALITVVLSPWLSQWLFKSDKYTVSFILLSSFVLLTGMYNGHYAILQGTRRLKLMAQANIFGAVAGFLCSVPMFYFFRNEGIVWALILTALTTTIVSYYYAKKVKLIPVIQSYKESYTLGLKTVRLGIMMAISSVAVLFLQFAIKTFIVRLGGLADVGLYHAGWALNTTYLGMIFTAMGKDYFPRLSQNVDDLNATNAKINEQSEIAILILAPLIIAMLVFLPFLIQLLYSIEFIDMIPMTKWFLIGSLIKAGSWGISFVFLAKGDGKIFLFNELGILLVTLPAYLVGYYWFGLEGIGYAFIFSYVIYFVWVAIVAAKKYNIKYNSEFWRIFLVLLITLLVFPLGEYLWGAKYITGVVLIFVISVFSFYELNKRIKFKLIIESIINKYGIKKK
jgi:O-antigen/teichoic acid export membrane protein